MTFNQVCPGDTVYYVARPVGIQACKVYNTEPLDMPENDTMVIRLMYDEVPRNLYVQGKNDSVLLAGYLYCGLDENRAISLFKSTASHEIKTDMSNIPAYMKNKRDLREQLDRLRIHRIQYHERAARFMFKK